MEFPPREPHFKIWVSLFPAPMELFPSYFTLFPLCLVCRVILYPVSGAWVCVCDFCVFLDFWVKFKGRGRRRSSSGRGRRVGVCGWLEEAGRGGERLRLLLLLCVCFCCCVFVIVVVAVCFVVDVNG